jgi:PST family polysaccharide transporter
MFGTENYGIFIIIFSISFPLAVYPNTTSSILQGLKRIKQLAIINVLRSTISLFMIIPIVYFFRLEGAIFSVIIVTLVHLILNHYFLSKEDRKFVINNWFVFDTDIFKKLFKYGVTSLSVGTAYYLSHLILKILIVGSLGLSINGIYQPVWALTMTYLTIVLSSMSAYSYPRLCELRSLYDINEELNGIIRVAFLIIMPAMFFLLVARKPIIMYLYSTDFLPATIYMPMQIFGDFFKLLFWALGMYLLPMKRLLGFIMLNILIDFLLVILAYFLIDIYQLHGVTVSFTLSHLIGFIALLIYSKKKIKFRFWPINFLLVMTSLTALILIVVSERYLTFGLHLAVGIFVLILWTIICIRKNEVLKLKSYLIITFSNKLAKN